MDSSTTSTASSGATFKSSVGDLDNPVHRVFRRSNFDSGIDDADHEAMKPGLQLASRLISRPTPLSCWYTILNGSVLRERYVISPLDEEEYHYEYHAHSPTLTEEQTGKAEADILSLARRVRFTVAEEDVAPSQAWVMATNRAAEDENRAVIKIRRAAINQLREAAERSAAQDDDRPYYVLMSFTLAKTLVHELVHAAHFAAYSDGEYCYFPGSAVCEEGFEWENEIFGGIIDFRVVAPTPAEPSESYYVYIVPWPNPHKAAYCLEDEEQSTGIRLRHSSAIVPKAQDDESNRSYIEYIDFKFLERLFQEDFWTKDVIEKGPGAFQPERYDRVSRKVSPELVQTMARTYRDAKESLEEQAQSGRDGNESEQLRELCEPWERFLAEWDAESL